jgi:hypothetical protein
MRARGINYDTGTFPGNSLTRKTFDSQAVRREMAVIAGDLHCDAVRMCAAMSCGVRSRHSIVLTMTSSCR